MESGSMPERVLVGRYQTGRVLGKGGMGVVVEGMHLELRTGVAIKLLRDDHILPTDIERFLREARAAAKLRGENICRVHDVGTADDGVPFMVMELLAGCDLQALLSQMGKLAPGVVADYMVQACTALSEAHALGIVHRDIKPTNVFRTRRPDGSPLIKILDFGLAKSINGQDHSLTRTSKVMGSPAYMAPEQLKSNKNVDPRIDVWSLGVVMYELVSGTRPFEGDSVAELALSITEDPPKPLPDFVPAELRSVIMRCLEKHVGARYQSVAELADALQPFVKPEKVAAVVPVDPDTAPDLDIDIAIPKPRPRGAWIALVASVLVLAGVVAYVVAQRAEDPPAAPPPVTPPILLPAEIDAAVPAAVIVDLDAAPVVEVDAAPVAPPPTQAPPRPRDKHPKPRDLRNSRY